jgi:hypothetical protein
MCIPSLMSSYGMVLIQIAVHRGDEAVELGDDRASDRQGQVCMWKRVAPGSGSYQSGQVVTGPFWPRWLRFDDLELSLKMTRAWWTAARTSLRALTVAARSASRRSSGLARSSPSAARPDGLCGVDVDGHTSAPSPYSRALIAPDVCYRRAIDSKGGLRKG